MAKFVMECPQCHNYVMASKVFNRKVKCTCGYEITVKNDRMAAKECPHCRNTVIYDQTKGEKALCPICKQPINTAESMKNAVSIHCPSCTCELTVDKSSSEYTCPLCETSINVQKEIERQKIKNKGLASVIKYEGGNDVFVFKHPIEDFNLGSQLIVHESQEAIFFRDGQALDLFGAGRYTLATQNLPLLETLYKLPTNSDEIFHSEIYFINMTTQMGIKWGTDSKVRLFDPASGLHIEIGACGQFNLRVADSRKFVIKVVGTAGSFTQQEIFGDYSERSDDENINGKVYTSGAAVAHFKGLIISKVKSFLAKAIKDNNINILEVDERIDELSDYLRLQINVVLDDYGLTMPEFFITSISTPDDNADYQRLKKQFAERTLLVRQEEVKKAEAEAARQRLIVEAQTEAQLKTVSAQGEAEALKIKAQAEAEAYKAQAFAEAAEMKAKGYTYTQETARQVGLEAMQNGITGSGSGGAGSLGDIASLGVTLGAMGGVIGMTKEAIDPILGKTADIGAEIVPAATASDNTWDCACGNKSITGNFCSNCGAKKPETADTWDCACGNKGITGNFCSNCGAKRPEKPKAWDCACGNKGITGNFCSNCGAKRPEESETWDCPACGKKGITGNFCDNCGKAKE